MIRAEVGVCGKFEYRNPQRAWATVIRQTHTRGAIKSLNVYHCPQCHLWHTTSLMNRSRHADHAD